MKKILLIFALLAGTVNAGPYVQRVSIPDDGEYYKIMYVEKGVQYCWLMPEWVQMSFFPYSPMLVTEAAINYNWLAGTPETALACAEFPKIPRTVSNRAFTFEGNGNLYRTEDVPLGVPCGDKIATYQLYHAVHYQGRDFIGTCW